MQENTCKVWYKMRLPSTVTKARTMRVIRKVGKCQKRVDKAIASVELLTELYDIGHHCLAFDELQKLSHAAFAVRVAISCAKMARSTWRMRPQDGRAADEMRTFLVSVGLAFLVLQDTEKK